jgi:hypothetical protein
MLVENQIAMVLMGATDMLTPDQTVADLQVICCLGFLLIVHLG